MNIIEQYGGYEEARKALDWLHKNDPIHSFMKPTLVNELLQYRRENNIYEVRDKVVYKGKAGLSGLFEIETLTKTGKPKTVKTKRFGNFPCRYCEVQHATDKEIAQGYRDE